MVPDTSPQWDHPITDQTQSYIICTTPRTGSNLLAFTLAAQGLGTPLEYLNLRGNPALQDFMARMLKLPSGQNLIISSLEQLTNIRRSYLAQLQNHRTTPNGYFGTKIFAHHLELLFPEHPTLESFCSHIHSPSKIIYLYRQDICSMAISFYFAQRKGQWFSTSKMDHIDTVEVPYDFQQLLHHVKGLHGLQSRWQTLLNAYPHTEILSLNYRSLIEQFNGTLSQVNAFLNSPNIPIPEAPIPKQSSPEKTAMVERFKEECRIKEPWVFDVDYSLNSGTTL